MSQTSTGRIELKSLPKIARDPHKAFVPQGERRLSCSVPRELQPTATRKNRNTVYVLWQYITLSPSLFLIYAKILDFPGPPYNCLRGSDNVPYLPGFDYPREPTASFSADVWRTYPNIDQQKRFILVRTLHWKSPVDMNNKSHAV